MNRKVHYLIALLILLSAILIHYSLNHEKEVSTDSGFDSSVNSFTLTSITYGNLASELSSNKMVKAIPEDSTLLLKFYNFKSGEREWERSFTITRGKIVQGGDSGDIVISIDSKYLNGMSNQNFCSIIQKANKNGDLGFETSMSKAALLWKFKGMMEYKDCFGL